ncbi:MAG: JAB domain-containing protein [Minisyncoccia bacterium]
MKNVEHKNDDGKRYLKKYEIVETDVELPIQGQVRDPEDLYKFLKDLEDEAVSKVIGIYLDDKNLFLGHQVFLGSSPKNLDTQMLWHYFSLFLAKKFMVLINHPGSTDPTPNEDDKKLMRALQADSQVLSFKPFFEDFIIVAKRSYFSMATNDGTAGYSSNQEHITKF